MGNHEYWDTPEYRAEQARQEADERRRNVKARVLGRIPAGAFPVEDLRILMRPPGGYNPRFARSVYSDRDEAEFDRMLARVLPGRRPACDRDHDGSCDGGCPA